MKQNDKTMVALGILMALFICFAFVSNSPPPCPMVFTTEQKVDLTNHAVVKNVGNFRISEFTVNVKTDNLAHLPMKVETITDAAFCDLKNISDGICASTGQTNTLTALKINYGFGYGKIMALYQPVALVRKYYNAGTKLADYEVARGNAPRYYYYNTTTNQFLLVGIGDTTCFKKYQDSIRIIKHTGVAHSPFAAGDVESVVYTFQEIKELIDSNPNEKIILWNAVRKKEIALSDSSHHHELMFGPESLPGPEFIFAGKFANLGHLCPPSCGAALTRLRFKMIN